MHNEEENIEASQRTVTDNGKCFWQFFYFDICIYKKYWNVYICQTLKAIVDVNEL